MEGLRNKSCPTDANLTLAPLTFRLHLSSNKSVQKEMGLRVNSQPIVFSHAFA